MNLHEIGPLFIFKQLFSVLELIAVNNVDECNCPFFRGVFLGFLISGSKYLCFTHFAAAAIHLEQEFPLGTELATSDIHIT